MTEPSERAPNHTSDRTPSGAPQHSTAPQYKGAPLDAARGPGLGCFWIQVVVLAILLVATPLTVVAGAPSWVSAAMLIVTLVLLLFAGQTVIFLLRLVAADRRSRRRPLSPGARPTVGDLEERDRPPTEPPTEASTPPTEPSTEPPTGPSTEPSTVRDPGVAEPSVGSPATEHDPGDGRPPGEGSASKDQARS